MNSTCFPVAIVFAIASAVFLASGNSLWISLFPIAVTFGILSFTDGGGKVEDEDSAADTPPEDRT